MYTCSIYLISSANKVTNTLLKQFVLVSYAEVSIIELLVLTVFLKFVFVITLCFNNNIVIRFTINPG